jgi:hypothetical protein
LGVVLAAPLTLMAVFLLAAQLYHPTGPRKEQKLPPGTVVATPPTWPDLRAIRLISEQDDAGVKEEPNTVVVGRVLRKEPRPEDPRLDDADPEWFIFQLRDGREIAVATANESAAIGAAVEFLFEEKQRGKRFTVSDNMQFEGVKVTFPKPWNADPMVVWPNAAPRTIDWIWAALAFGAAVTLYLITYAIGWVIDGFAKPGPAQ